MKDLLTISGLMKQTLAALTLGAMVTFSAPAHAGPCDSKAAQVAASKGAQLLGVRAKGDKCHIKLLIKPAKGPPKRTTVVVSK